MTAPYQRTSVEGVLANHEKRVGILEAVPSFGNYEIKVVADASALATGDGQFIFAIPSDLNGTDLLDAQAFVTTVATGATLITVQIRNVTQTADMLSTRITIDASEFTSYTAATPRVINVANSGVVTGDLIAIDVDAVGNTTPGQGLGVILRFA